MPINGPTGAHTPDVLHTNVAPPASSPNAKYLDGLHGPPCATPLVTFGTQSAE
jgi:hypothetical protein